MKVKHDNIHSLFLLFIHLVSKYLESDDHILDIILGTEDTSINNTKILTLVNIPCGG